MIPAGVAFFFGLVALAMGVTMLFGTGWGLVAVGAGGFSCVRGCWSGIRPTIEPTDSN